MARADITLPTIGLPITTEDPKIIAALDELEASANNIESAQITSAATEFRVFEAPQTWQSVALIAAFGVGANLRFYKDIMGVVRFRGDVYNLSADITQGTTVATLPSGHRPDATARGILTQYGGSARFPLSIIINTDGTVVTDTPVSSSDTGSLFSVHFRAA